MSRLNDDTPPEIVMAMDLYVTTVGVPLTWTPALLRLAEKQCTYPITIRGLQRAAKAMYIKDMLFISKN